MNAGGVEVYVQRREPYTKFLKRTSIAGNDLPVLNMKRVYEKTYGAPDVTADNVFDTSGMSRKAPPQALATRNAPSRQLTIR